MGAIPLLELETTSILQTAVSIFCVFFILTNICRILDKPAVYCHPSRAGKLENCYDIRLMSWYYIYRTTTLFLLPTTTTETTNQGQAFCSLCMRHWPVKVYKIFIPISTRAVLQVTQSVYPENITAGLTNILHFQAIVPPPNPSLLSNITRCVLAKKRQKACIESPCDW